jgi:hypothetical protein
MSTKSRFKKENDISLLIKQISEPTFYSKQQTSIAETTKTPLATHKYKQKSYSFLFNKQLKRQDSSSFTSSSLSTNLSNNNNNNNCNSNKIDSYLFARQSSTNCSFMGRNFIKTKSSLLSLFFYY